MYEYKIKLIGDLSGIEEEVQKKLGNIAKEVKNNSITVAFDYDIDMNDLQKRFDEIEKLSPEIGLKFRYDFNKRLLEDEKKRLSELEINADTSKLEQRFEQLYDKMTLAPPDVDIEPMERELAQIVKTLELLHEKSGKVFAPLEDSNIGQFLADYEDEIEKAKPLKIVDPKEIDAARARVDALTSSIKDLEARGADKLGIFGDVDSRKVAVEVDYEAATEAVKKIKDTLDELPDEKKIKITVDSTADAPLITDANGNVLDFYRGTSGSMAGLVSRGGSGYGGGTYFSTSKEAAKSYGEKVHKANLAAKDILDIDAQGADYEEVVYLGQNLDEASERITQAFQKIKKFTQQIEQGKGDIEEAKRKLAEAQAEFDSISNDDSNLYGKHSTDYYAQNAQRFGYDAVAVRNVMDGGGQAATDVVVFDKAQIRNAEIMRDTTAEIAENISKINAPSSESVLPSPEAAEQFKKTLQSVLDDNTSIKVNVIPDSDRFIVSLQDDLDNAYITIAVRPTDSQAFVDSLQGMVAQADINFSLGNVLLAPDEQPAVMARVIPDMEDFTSIAQEDLNRYGGTIKVPVKPEADEESVLNFASDLQSRLNNLDPLQIKVETGDDNVSAIAASNGELLKESAALTDVFSEATKAAKAKEEFTKANERLGESAQKSAEDIKKEQESLEKIAAEKAAKKFGKQKQKLADEVGSLSDKAAGKYLNQDYQNRLGNLTPKLANAKTADDLKAIRTEIDALNKAIANTPSADSISNLYETIAQLKNANPDPKFVESLEKIESSIENFKTPQDVTSALKAIENAKIVNVEDYERLHTVMQSLPAEIKSLQSMVDSGSLTQTGVERVTNLINTLKSVYAQKNDFELLDQNAINAIEQADEGLIKLKQDVKDVKAGNLLKLQKNLQDIHQTLSQNSGMSADLRSRFEALAKETDSFARSADTSQTDVANLTKRLMELKTEMIKTGQTGKGMFDIIGNRLSDMNAKFIAQYFSIQDWIRYLTKAKDAVVQLDTALTELRKVSDATEDRLAKSFQTSSGTAKELGATISDVINITADWSRLGETIDDAEKLAKVTTLFKNVGDNMSAEDASSFMISAMKGFRMGADEAEHIVDVYNEVANNFAIDTAGIGEAIKRSAASLMAGNTSLEEAVALVTTANSVAQDPASIGTAFKTMSARVRASKVELEELGEAEDGVIESTASLRKYIKGITGFDILEKDNKTFKSLYDILLGIGREFKNLDDVTQAALSEKLFGKRMGNIGLAVLNDVEQLERVYQTAMNAEGSAQREQENYAKSVQYSIDVLKASGQELASDVLDSQALKTGIDLLQKFVDILDKLIKQFGVLGPLVAGGGIFANVKALRAQNIFNSIAAVLKVNGGSDAITSYFAGGEVISEGLFKALNAVKGDKSLLSSMGLDPTEVAKGLEIIDDGLDLTTESIKNSTIAAKALKGSLISLGAAGTVVALYALYKAFKDYNVALEENRKAAAEQAEALIQQRSSTEETISKVSSLQKVLRDQSSTEEEIYNAKKGLLDIQDDLISKYGDEAQNIDLVNGSLEEQIRLIENLDKKSAADWLTNVHKGNYVTRFLGKEQTNREIGEAANDYMSARGETRMVFNSGDEYSATTKALNSVIDRLQKAAEKSGLTLSDYNPIASGYTLNNDNLTPEEFAAAAKEFNAELSLLIDGEYKNNEVIRGAIQNFQNSVTDKLSDLSSSINQNKQNAIAYGLGMMATSNAKTQSGESAFDFYDRVGEITSEYQNALASGNVTQALERSFNDASTAVDQFKNEFPEFSYIFDNLINQVKQSREYQLHQADLYVQDRYSGGLSRIQSGGYTDVDARAGLSNSIAQDDLAIILKYYESIGVKQEEAIARLADMSVFTRNVSDETETLSDKWSTASERASGLKNIIASAGEDGKFADLSVEDTDLLSQYEEKYAELAALKERSSDQYLAALQSIQHLEAESANLEKYQEVQDAVDNIFTKVNENAPSVAVNLNTADATKKLYDLLGKDYELQVGITDDISVQTDQIVEKIDAMGAAFGSIGEGLQVAKEDVLNFATAFPEVAAQADVLSSGALQLSDALVNQAYDSVNAEIDAAKNGALGRIAAEREVLLAKADAADAAAEAARNAAAAIANDDADATEKRAEYQEKLADYTSLSEGDMQQNAIDTAGVQEDASKEVADNFNTNFGNMATSASNAYSSMMGSNADWAEQCISNAREVANAIIAANAGEAVGSSGVRRGSAGNTYEGKGGEKNSNLSTKEAKKSENTVKNANNARDAAVAELDAQATALQQQADALRAQAGNMTALESSLKGALDSYKKNASGARNGGNSSKSGGGGGGGSDKKDEAKEIDWMERMVDLLQKRHDLEKENADDEYRTYEQRIESTKELIRQDENLLKVYQKQSREYGVAYEKAYDKLRELGENGQLKDLFDNDVYGLGASYEELKKVNDQINELFSKYGKGNLDYNNRPYIRGNDGSWITMLTEGRTLKAGENEFSMVITPILESGEEINLDEYLGNIQDQINEKAANGEAISVDTILSLDKNNLIVTAAEGSWEANAAAFEQMESELQVLKDRAIELRDANVDGVKSLRDAVENGSLDISQFSGEIQEAIMNLIDMYDKVQGSREQEKKTLKEIKNHEQENFEFELNMIKERQRAIENEADIIQHSIEMRETAGDDIIRESDYEELIENSNRLAENYYEQLEVLEEQKASLDEGTAAWYNVVSQIYEVDSALRDVEKQQAEWNETIKQLPIRRIERYLQMLENIKTDIKNFNAEQDVLGINPGVDTYIDQFNLDVASIDKLNEKYKELQKNLKTYKYGTDKFEETSNAIQDCENNVSELIQSMREYNNQILNIPINKLNELVEKLEAIKSAMEEVQADNDLAINAAITLLEQEVEKYNKQIESIEKSYEKLIEPLQEQSDLIQDQIDELNKEADVYRDRAQDIQDQRDDLQDELDVIKEQAQAIRDQKEPLQEANDLIQEKIDALKEAADLRREEADAIREANEAEQEKADNLREQADKVREQAEALQDQADANKEQLALEKARFALEKARGDRTNKVLKGGEWTWEADIDKLKDAAEAVRDAELDKKLADIEREAKVYDDQADVIEKQIKADEKRAKAIDKEAKQMEKPIKPLEKQQKANDKAIKALEKQAAAIDKTGKPLEDQIDAYDKQIKNLNKQADVILRPVRGLENKQEEIADQIKGLEKERDALTKPLNDEIDRLGDIQDKWSTLERNRENELNYEKATDIFGDPEWMEKVLSGNDDKLWKKMDASYNEYLRGIDAYNEAIKDYQQMASIMSTYVAEYNKGNLTVTQVISQMTNMMTAARDGLTSAENLAGVLKSFSEKTSASALAKSATTVDNLYTDFTDYMRIVQDQNKVLDKYTQTWDQIHTSVQNQLTELKRLAEIEAEALKERKQYYKERRERDHDDGGSNGRQERWVAVDSSGKETVGNSYSDLMDKIGHHTGVKTGYIGGMTTDDKLRAIDDLTNTPLKKDDVPALLQKGEVVLTKDQQDNLLSHLVPLDSTDMLSRFSLGKDAINLSGMKLRNLRRSGVAQAGSAAIQQSFQFGDIHVTEAQNVTDIARGIMSGGLSQALTQQLYKR